MDFSGANLEESNLSNANLSKAIVLGTHLKGAKLDGAKLAFVEIRPALLEQADFSKANLENMVPLRLELLP